MKLPKLPQYKSHKQVGAIKISEIHRNMDGSATITPSEKDEKGNLVVDPFKVDRHFMTKFEPKVGGYIVSYEDGYTSFSPAEAFEEGYSAVVESEE